MPLTDRQRAQFDQFGARFSSPPAPATAPRASESGSGGNLLLTDDPTTSALPPHPITIGSLAELTELGRSLRAGSPATAPSGEPPSEWTGGRELDELTGEQEASLQRALVIAFTHGTDAVSSYADVLERRFFPLRGVLFQAENVTVPSGQQLVIAPDHDHNPHILNIGTLTLEPGSQIVCRCPVILNVQELITH